MDSSTPYGFSLDCKTSNLVYNIFGHAGLEEPAYVYFGHKKLETCVIIQTEEVLFGLI
ncbi:MAG: hypothetical protein JW837_02220 [Sedimentisphaerales bacterium]|nr:hypothetical protein [Sedimentisphaerales bacterium]